MVVRSAISKIPEVVNEVAVTSSILANPAVGNTRFV
jgi:hypothetical protein